MELIKDFIRLNASSHYDDMLRLVRDQILDSIRLGVKNLGGKINFAHYHEETNIPRYTFFTVDDDGHGVELFLSYVETENEDDLIFELEDSEQTYSYVWDLSDFNASNSNFVLKELENIARYLVDHNEEIVSE